MNRIVVLALATVIVLSCKKSKPVISKPVTKIDSVVVDTILYGQPEAYDTTYWLEVFDFSLNVYQADSIMISSAITAHYPNLTTRQDEIHTDYIGEDFVVDNTQKTFNSQTVIRQPVFKSNLHYWYPGGTMEFVYFGLVTSDVKDTILIRITYYQYKK